LRENIDLRGTKKQVRRAGRAGHYHRESISLREMCKSVRGAGEKKGNSSRGGRRVARERKAVDDTLETVLVVGFEKEPSRASRPPI